jgi:hypothetical protein
MKSRYFYVVGTVFLGVPFSVCDRDTAITCDMGWAVTPRKYL